MATSAKQRMSSVDLFIISMIMTFYVCVNCVSFDEHERTLYVASENRKAFDFQRTIVIDSEFYLQRNSDTDLLNIQEDNGKKRTRRSATPPTPGSRTSHSPTAVSVQLSDNHTQMIVHWAGAGSDVIIALSRSSHQNNLSTSNLFISYNYGKSFENMKSKVRFPSGEVPIINHYYNSHVYNSHYIFTDTVHNYIFTTVNYGLSFTSHMVPFTPTTLSLHETNPNLVLGMNKNDTQKRLYLSKDFGNSWMEIQSGVEHFYWGVKPYDNPNVIYIQVRQLDMGYSILKSEDFFRFNHQTLMQDVVEFKIEGAYMFATKQQQMLFGAKFPVMPLWVSYKRGKFKNAVFSEKYPRYDYYVADASEDQVFVVVTHNKTTGQSHLYISDITGSEYSLSLKDIVYYNPKGAHKDTWLRYFAKKPFVDLTKVKGLKGVYIASQVINGSITSSFRVDNQRSMITFDKGGEWSLINPPKYDINGKKTNYTRCTIHSKDCSTLHLTQEFSRLYPTGRAIPIMSKESVPGILIASGVVGKSLKNTPNVYMSSDAGYTWRNVLNGHYFYAMGDHGGLIVAVPQFQNTHELLYSWNEGETWTTYSFHNESIRVYGVLTEPGEATAVFSIFGSHLGRHRWLIIQVNMSSIFPTNCSNDDYKLWSFPDNPPFAGCILGRKLEIERRNSHSFCYNRREYDRKINEKNCTCRREDYECDFGFNLEESIFSKNQKCVEDKDIENIHKPPTPCPPGTFYPYSRGYRKIAGDTCKYGEDYRYDPLMYSCPVTELPEFLIYSTRTSVHRVILGKNSDEILYRTVSSSIYATEFDYHGNCMFVSTSSEIFKTCYGKNNHTSIAMPVISSNIKTVEALGFDWTSQTLYWIDSGYLKIEVAKQDGRYRRELVNSTHLERPRALALDPRFGYMYWTDWSARNPRIVKSWMDGSHIQVIINNTGSTQNIHWPNGLAIDFRQSKLYWTDAYLDRIVSCDMDGKNKVTVTSGTYYVRHPYSIGLFKDSIYWADWQLNAILTANKYSGNGYKTVRGNISSIMDLKVYTQTSQSAQSRCSAGNGHCSQLCIPRPQLDKNQSKQNRTCLCGGSKFTFGNDNSEHCTCDDKDTILNGVCTPNNTVASNCTSEHFTCGNGKCIPATWLCDHDDDCHDGSDEFDCPDTECTTGNIQCASGTCIPERWKCDHDQDCDDGSDEANCVYRNCTDKQFTCNNQRCIPDTWRCDKDDDCHDNSDEVDCNYNETCANFEFHCTSHQPKCVPITDVCNGKADCLDGSDEKNCSTCPSYKWRCADNSSCIYNNWKCDGDFDCPDHSDEKNCVFSTTHQPSTTSAPCQFRCHSYNQCVTWRSRCDGFPDCRDGSDEYNCVTTTRRPTIIPTTKSGMTFTCADDEFKCWKYYDPWVGFTCIEQTWVCDNETDCKYGEDELNCTSKQTCPMGYFKCMYQDGCVAKSLVCDGKPDCGDGSDEHGCAHTGVITTPTPAPPTKCDAKHFTCSSQFSHTCVLWLHLCDWSNPCYMFSTFCHKRVNVTNLFASYVSGNTITVAWKLPRSSFKVKSPFSYIVSFLEHENDNSWANVTVKKKMSCTLKKLRANTEYDITVYVKSADGVVYPPVQPMSVITNQQLPSNPTSFQVYTYKTDAVVLTWKPPALISGQINSYKIYWQSSDEKKSHFHEYMGPFHSKADETLDYKLMKDTDLQVGKKYEIWMSAVNDVGEGAITDKKTITFDEGAINKKVKNLKFKTVDQFSVTLSWSAVEWKDIQGYNVTYVDLWQKYTSVSTKKTTLKISNLCSGSKYTFQVAAYNDHGDGPRSEELILQTLGSTPVLQLKQPKMIENTQFYVEWTMKNKASVSKNVGYTLFYAYTAKDLDLGTNITRNARSIQSKMQHVTLKGLRACEVYYLKVAVTSPGSCPLSEMTTLTTGEDVYAEPENVTFHFINKTMGNLTWESACFEQIENVGYVVTLVEDSTNRSSVYKKYTSTKDILMWELFGPLARGGSYTFTVTRHLSENDPKKPRSSEPVKVQVEPYAAPMNLLYHFDEGNPEVHFTWDPDTTDFPDNQLFKGYELYWRKSHQGNSHTELKYERQGIYKKSDAKVRIEPGYLYHLKVRVSTMDGYFGLFSPECNITPTEIEGRAASQSVVSLTKTNLIAIIVSITVVVIALVTVLAFFIVRHRRLQRSFMAFANSHYDSRSGTTTFTANDIGEEEDSPMIQGFSDDEPLVIA